jgi:hydroxymethylglutaryl-CoA lyase
MPQQVTVVEVSPRDGLQNESTILSTDAKVELIGRLVDAGVRRIEAVSFAHPRLVPAMADAEAVMAQVPRKPDVSYAGLILNRRGLDRALNAGVDEINVVVAATDTFSQRNQNVSADEAMRMAEDVIAAARSHGLFTTLTISTAFGCPFEGAVSADQVIELARRGAEAGVHELCFGDTIGVGVPSQVREFTLRVRAEVGTEPGLRFHFHNTRNTGFANAFAALLDDVTVLDASAGGIGGCPFAPKATGNIATEDLVYMLHRMGWQTGLDLAALLPVAEFLTRQLGHQVPAMLPRAGLFP